MPAPFSIPAATLHKAFDHLASEIAARHRKTRRVVLLGISKGGIEPCRRLSNALAAAGVRTLAGTLDVSFHRDDIGIGPIPHSFHPTHVPCDVTGATIILVDDVLHSGRTIKAALDELFDHGRPACVELAVLIDRGDRRLPVSADYTGISIELSSDEKLVVRLDPARPSADSAVALPAKA